MRAPSVGCFFSELAAFCGVLIPLLAHGEPLMVDFSRSDRDGVEPLQPGWQGFGLPATGGE